MFDKIEFILGEAFTSLRRNKWMTFAAISTSAMALFILGGLGYAYIRVSNSLEGLSEDFKMNVFMDLDATPERTQAVAAEILAFEDVATATIIGREDAWDAFVEENPDLAADLDNPLPDKIEISLHDIGKAEEVEEQIGAIQGVNTEDGIRYDAEVQAFLKEALTLIRFMGISLGGLMLITSAVLIFNAIRLTILARNKELGIMSLVGASRATIWSPLLIEGVVQGSVGGAIAGVVLWAVYGMVAVAALRFQALGIGAFPTSNVMILLISCGAVFGLICSILAVRQPGKAL